MVHNKTRTHIYFGCLAGSLLVLLFLTVVSAVNWGSPTGALREINRVWHWVLLLAAGFGTQIALFSYIRNRMRNRALTAEVAATGTISTGSMLACCAHVLTGLLPLLGFSAAAVLLAQYQLPLILLGVVSNAVGLTIMMGIINAHQLFTPGGRMELFCTFPWKRIRTIVLIAGSILIAGTTVFAGIQVESPTAPTATSELLPLRDHSREVEIAVSPRIHGPEEPFEIAVNFDTHTADLSFDLSDVTILRDDTGRTYRMLSEEGDPPGGHHRGNILTFESISPEAKSIELIFRNINGTDRVYSWEL